MLALARRSSTRLAALLGLGAALLTGCGPVSPSRATAPPPSVGTVLDQTLPASVLALPLVDSAGEAVHLRDFRGRTIVLSDSMTLCQETCPLDTATVVQTARDEDTTALGSEVVYLSISVDPPRDTPSQLAAYQKLFTPTPKNWHTLTGSSANINALWSFLGVWRQRVAEPAGQAPTNWRTGVALTYDVAHSDEVFFIDKTGHERFILEGPPVASRGQIPDRIYTFMRAEGHQHVTSPPSTAWTEPQARQVLAWLDGRD